MAYGDELDVALAAACEAARILRRHWRGHTETWEKSEDNPVTEADLEADRSIVARLRAAFPGDAILSEETAHDADRTTKRRAWIVDPMDGTKEFIARIPEFAVSIALVVDGEPVVGAIVNPAAGVSVFASRDAGAHRARLDGSMAAVALRAAASPVSVSACTRLEDAELIASRTEISRDQLATYTGWCRTIRPMGSIAWKLACIASGEADLNVSVAPKNEWDVCAGDLVVREAGGVYCAFDGSRRRYNQADPRVPGSMVAGPKALVEAFRARERARH
jgi:myo-inositol-1(or 4)-monophosphatase